MEYKEVLSVESFGHINHGIKILFSDNIVVGDDFSDLKRALNKTYEELREAICLSEYKRQPEYKEKYERTRKAILECFRQEEIYVEEIPNGYTNSYIASNDPWFVVTTRFGPITIGWRRSVIHIGWDNNNSLKNCDGNLFFGEEDTTKSRYLIHAWSYQRAKAYIAKLKQWAIDNKTIQGA